MSVWRSTRRLIRGEQSARGDEVDEKNDQIAHCRIVEGWQILRNLGRNNNSPETTLQQPRDLNSRMVVCSS
jgi:hypothetical protein